MFQTLTESKTNSGYKESKNNIISWQWLRQRLFSISPEEATFARRGFQGNDAKLQERLEEIGYTFLQGYHFAIANHNSDILIPHLNAIDTELRGFAFEGAAMGLALLDILTPWQQNRMEVFLTGGGADHIYMVYVGMGWALARIPFGIERYLARLNQSNQKYIDPLLGWLAIDGYGFHQGYFYAPRYVENKVLPPKLSGYALRVFDQGLGRSLWFVYGANVTNIARNILDFHPSRQSDIWSGIGLACTYAGGVDSAAIAELRIAAGEYQPHLAQGAAFAAKTRLRAGNLTPHTEMATQILCGMGVNEAAEITDIALEDLPQFPLVSPERRLQPPSIPPQSAEVWEKNKGGEELPPYEIWRRRIQREFQ